METPDVPTNANLSGITHPHVKYQSYANLGLYIAIYASQSVISNLSAQHNTTTAYPTNHHHNTSN